MTVTGNTILITGGTSGIGLALAKQLNMMNNKVIVCGRREDRLTDIKRQNSGIITKVCDVDNAQQRVDLTEWVFQNYPDVNVLINNAGIQLETDLTMTGDLSAVIRETETNFIAPIHFTQMFAPHFMVKEQSAIVNITSGLAFVPMARTAVYCATKAAMHSLSLSLRQQLKNTAVKVFEIAPPMVDTELGHENRNDETQTHGGMPVDEFANLAIDALENDVYEAAIGDAAHLREQPEKMFAVLNR